MLETIENLDKYLTKVLFIPTAVENTVFRLLFLSVEWMIHGIPWLVISGFGFLYSITQQLPIKYQWKWTILFLSILFDLVMIGLIKIIFRRKRPSENAGDQIYEAPIADKYSFPSGHSSRAAMLMILGFTFFTKEFYLQILFFTMIVGYSRIAMGRHYFFDVLAGIFLGIFEGILILQLPYNITKILVDQFPFLLFMTTSDVVTNQF